MEPDKVLVLGYDSLVRYTDNFSESNCIGDFQFGKLYRGKTTSCGETTYLMVKMWEVPNIYNRENPQEDYDVRLMEEVILLGHELLINHPCMVKIYGYYSDGGKFGVVYVCKPFDLVFNLVPKEDFTWLQRIKAALGLASLLRHLHARKSAFYQPFLVHNLDAANIVLDEDYNPKLCDYGSITGGIFPDKRIYSCRRGCYGCTDIALFNTGRWSNKQDVFAFGVIHLSLISKKVYTDQDTQAGAPFVFEWALTEYKGFESKNDMKNIEFSLVHGSLTAEDDFCTADGHKITMLALECVNGDEHRRPTMKQVVKCMLKLELVKQNADFLGANKVLTIPQ